MTETPHQTMTPKQFYFLSASTACSILAFAAFNPAQVIALNHLELSAFINGFITSIFFITILAIGPFVYKFVDIFGHSKLYFIAKMLLSLSYLIILIDQSAWAWGICTLFMGMGAAIIWPITEACIAELAPQDKKGKYTGLYQVIVGVAFAIGPLIAAILSSHLFILMIFCFAVSALSYLPIKSFPWDKLCKTESFLTIDPKAKQHYRYLVPILVISSFIGGFYENGLNGLSILVGKAAGFDDYWAVLLPGALAVGSLCAQYPVGLWADRHKANKMLVIAFALLIFSTLLLPLGFVEKQALWPIVLIWGAVSGAMYTLSLIIISKQVDKQYIVQFTGIMVGAYTVGCALSPAAGGFFFDHSHMWGITLGFTAILAAAFVATALLLRRYRTF